MVRKTNKERCYLLHLSFHKNFILSVDYSILFSFHSITFLLRRTLRNLPNIALFFIIFFFIKKPYFKNYIQCSNYSLVVRNIAINGYIFLIKKQCKDKSESGMKNFH